VRDIEVIHAEKPFSNVLRLEPGLELILERVRLFDVAETLLDGRADLRQELYAPLKQALANQDSHETKLDVVCRVSVDLAAWVARGAELFDLRKTGSFRDDEIEKIAKFKLQRAWAACDAPTLPGLRGTSECSRVTPRTS
jgi:hypothetical protein